MTEPQLRKMLIDVIKASTPGSLFVLVALEPINDWDGDVYVTYNMEPKAAQKVLKLGLSDLEALIKEQAIKDAKTTNQRLQNLKDRLSGAVKDGEANPPRKRISKR